MSTIRANALTDAAGNNSSTAEQLRQGRAKAWFNLNGTGTIAQRDSFNIASFTDNGTGDYSCTFAANMPNVNFSTAFNGRASGITTQWFGVSDSNSVSSLRVITVDAASLSFLDAGWVHATVDGD